MLFLTNIYFDHQQMLIS